MTAKVMPLNNPTIYRVGAGDPRFVFVPGIVKPLAVGNVERAAFIVRACNAHDDLLAALRVAHGWMYDNCEPDNAAFETVSRALAKALL